MATEVADREEVVAKALDAMEFIFAGYVMEDEQAIRAMVIAGASYDQIIHGLVRAALNHRVAEQDKTRYAYGVVRNLMEREQSYE